MDWAREEGNKRRNVSSVYINNETADGAKETFSQGPSAIWFSIFLTEFIVIFIVNAVTLIVFARNRHLRKRTTYLIINLTVADLLVGAVSGPLGIYFTYEMEHARHGFRLREFSILTFGMLFPGSSLVNLSVISLERLHATLYPFRHCLIEKWVYYKIIVCCWLMLLILAPSGSVLFLYEPVAYHYALVSFNVFTLLILTMSYVVIVVQVKCNPPPQPFGSLASDRKLSVTLLIVTIASILTNLPWAIRHVQSVAPLTWPVTISSQRSPAEVVRIAETTILFYANSFVNPLIYTIRMQEFRKALKLKGLIFGKETPGPRRAQPIELHAM